jgi:uncharacterized protein involved in outer membrane biogenesis
MQEHPMAASTRNKILIGGGAIVGLLVVLLLAAPLFIDANAYKAQIIAQVKKATGRDLVLDGPISVVLLPAPAATANGVKFFNAPGAKNPNMVEVKSVTVKLSLAALLTGSLVVSDVVLVEPKIVLEINSEGKPNWEFTPSVAEAKAAAAKPSSPAPLSLGRLAIDNGTLIFSDSKAGLSVTAEKANLTASVGALDGPYALAGNATVNGFPLKVDLSVGAKGASGHETQLALETGGGNLSFKGSLSELGPKARLSGLLSSSADNLIAFAETLLKIAGQPEPALPPLLAGRFTFDGMIDLSQTAVAAKDFRLALGQDSGSGSLVVTLRPALAVDGKLAAPKLDLDRWLATLSRPPAPQAQAPPPAGATASPQPAATPSLLATINATLALEVGEVIYNKQPVRNVAVDLQARGGAVSVPKLSATLPGDMVLQAKSTLSGDATRPTVSGEFSLVGAKLRETLAWLEVDTSAFPPNKLARFSLKGRMASSAGNVQVSDAVFELDDVKGSGGIVVAFGMPLSIVTHVELDTLDLDSYLAPGAARPAPPAAASAAPPAAPVEGPSIGFKAKVVKLIWHKETISGVEIDIATRGNTLRLNDVKVSNLVGARLAVRGTIANYSSNQPRPDIAFNFEAPDMDRVLKLAGVASSGLGAVAASGGVAGNLDQLSLREFTVHAVGQSLQATGTLALPGAAQGSLKSAAYKGTLVLNGQTLDGSIEAGLSGRPALTADLHASVLDLDKIGGGSAPARPPARPQATAVAKPIDPAPLRAFDASLKLVAGTLISPPLRIGNADVAATLKDGVLTVGHFKGSLYGGSLNLSGVVNATQPALSFDFKGDANGLYVGEMLRSTSGTNQFGSSIKVTVDGRLNANGITLRSSGFSSAQLKGSMAGGAELSGHLYLGTDKALQVLGSTATGIVGGVLDNTVGNVLDIFGQGRAAPTSIVSAVSVILKRFVNRDSPLSGHIDIAGGVLTDRGLTVQGDRATARVATRTNLVNSTTDTTVNFIIAEDPSAPYVTVTARGALASPSIGLSRGAAKDPPGIVSTLPGVGNLLPGQGGSGQQAPSRSPIPGLPLPSIPNLFGR